MTAAVIYLVTCDDCMYFACGCVLLFGVIAAVCGRRKKGPSEK